MPGPWSSASFSLAAQRRANRFKGEMLCASSSHLEVLWDEALKE